MSYPPSSYPPSGDYQGGGGYPPAGGKTKTLNLDYNIAALLCYLPLCCINVIAAIVFLVTEPKESRFVRFHALQSLFLLGAWFALGIVLFILGFILGSLNMGLLLFPIQMVVILGMLIVYILAMVKSYQNQMWKLPIIGDLAEKQL